MGGPARDRRTIELKDAPMRSVLELVRRGFDLPAFVIDYRVRGTRTIALRSLTIEQAMDRLCASGEPKLEWSRIGVRLIRVRGTDGVRLPSALPKVRPAGVPLGEDGLLYRVCGILEGGARAWALIETNASERPIPPASTLSGMLPVYIVRVGDRLGRECRVARIERDGVIVSGPRPGKIPFVGRVSSGYGTKELSHPGRSGAAASGGRGR